VRLGPGEVFVVPKGVEHRPVAEDEAHILLIEPRGTPNTGNTRPQPLVGSYNQHEGLIDRVRTHC
jgi:mannose-6-phosphate isomerase-like protein (cupin superfamily)